MLRVLLPVKQSYYKYKYNYTQMQLHITFEIVMIDVMSDTSHSLINLKMLTFASRADDNITD